mgnify:CR=1 FL=1
MSARLKLKKIHNLLNGALKLARLEHAYNIKIEHYYKWNRRWLELAEKFKETK